MCVGNIFLNFRFLRRASTVRGKESPGFSPWGGIDATFTPFFV
jgi:hypothetical protein